MPARVKAKKPAVEEVPHGYEFFGPPGAFAISFVLPVVIYIFHLACNDTVGCPVPSAINLASFSFSSFSLDALKAETNWQGFASLFDLNVLVWTVIGVYGSSLILYRALPGVEVEGVELTSGGRLKYKFNAFWSTIVTLAGFVGASAVFGDKFPVWNWIWDNYTTIITAKYIISLAIATFVYVRSFSVNSAPASENREFAPGGTTGNMIYDWFIGRELNPRVTIPLIGEIDIKEFCELRPGMLSWLLLDITYIHHQYTTYGYVTDSMILATLFHTIYVFDALYMEPAILTTIDITTDGFGMMLSFGDLCWVPLIYSMQARYLALYPLKLGIVHTAGIVALCGAGYYVFRSTNNEKNVFRTNPSDPRVAHLTYIQTAQGSKLLTSGWWGMARHINYLGDWTMSWAWCLPTGLSGFQVFPAIAGGPKILAPGGAEGWALPITYFYVIYFGVLLVHRERRDEAKCSRKYGADWEKYKKLVPSRIIPGIY